MEVNPNHSTRSELKKKATADKSDKTVKDRSWLLFDTSLVTSGFNLDRPMQFAGRIHRVIRVGLSIDVSSRLADSPGVLRPPSTVGLPT